MISYLVGSRRSSGLLLVASVAAVLLHIAIAQNPGDKQVRIEIIKPAHGDYLEKRSLDIEGVIHGLPDVPVSGEVLMDDRRVMEFTSPNVRGRLDGLGALAEGDHSLTVALLDVDGDIMMESTVIFTKVGSPEDYEGPFFDERFIDDSMIAMEESCHGVTSRISNISFANSLGLDDGGDSPIVAIAMPVLAAKLHFDGGPQDNLGGAVARDAWFDDLQELPMFKIFFPSLRESMVPQSKIRYEIYFGYDNGDRVFDNSESREAIENEIFRMFPKGTIGVKWFRYPRFQGKVFWIYEDLFRQAYLDGSHYFLMGNDDLQFETSGWAEEFISQLRDSPVHRNFGVAGPVDTRDLHKHHMTFSFAHRTHYEALGYFFPHAFPNWWSDFWVTLVYGRQATKWLKHVKVRNTEIAGRRYPAFWAKDGELLHEVHATRTALKDYCECLASGGRPRLEGCRF